MRIMSTAAASAVLAFAGLASAPEDASAQSRGAPRGSYAQSCSGAYVNQGRLYADCQDMRGRTRATSIDLSPCSSSDISNDDGLLVCGGSRGSYENNRGGGWGGGGNGANNGGGWNGGNAGRNGITVFTSRDYRGNSRSFRSEIYSLQNTDLNDQISSIQINGPWEVCSDPGFRGQCLIVEGNIRNLNNTGLNDRISSMRPVRGGGRW